MNEPDYDIELIERYFDEELTSDEMAQFERRLQLDQNFKRLFDRERLLIGAIKFEGALGDLEYLRETEKRGLFPDTYRADHPQPDSQAKVRRLIPYAISVAASLLIVVAAIFYFKSDSPQEMASDYATENLLYLSTTMSDESDSLRLGIAAYNNKDYDQAAQIFGSMAQRERSVEAIKNLGLTYLAGGEYEKALHQFVVLSDREDVYVNSGPFYKAVALMMRSAPGDAEEAKEILREVVQKQLPGHQVASGWLDRW